LSGVLDAGVGERRSATNVDKIALGHNTKWAGRLFILECVATRKENTQMQNLDGESYR